ncbi:hypothetical protein BH11PLA1_BH11PLA1_11050 [soil metagenome]
MRGEDSVNEKRIVPRGRGRWRASQGWGGSIRLVTMKRRITLGLFAFLFAAALAFTVYVYLDARAKLSRVPAEIAVPDAAPAGPMR